MNPIVKAARFARDAHTGMTRKFSGRPYYEHVARVAARVSMIPGATEEMIAAAYLHDTIEDCGVTKNELTEAFGPKVAHLVAELTNPSAFEPLASEKRAVRRAADRDHLSEVSREAKLIKMADRIDNLLDFSVAEAGDKFSLLFAKETRALLAVIGDANPMIKKDALAIVTSIEAEASARNEEIGIDDKI